MAQIFHPSTNTIAKLSIVGAILALPVIGVAGYAWNMSYGINLLIPLDQPVPFSQGQTVVAERSQIQLKQEGNGFTTLPAGARLSDVVRALNTLGATPQDLLATVYDHLGIDSRHEFRDFSGRPIAILGNGQPIRELVTAS